jgi:hypothetical protein
MPPLWLLDAEVGVTDAGKVLGHASSTQLVHGYAFAATLLAEHIQHRLAAAFSTINCGDWTDPAAERP